MRASIRTLSTLRVARQGTVDSATTFHSCLITKAQHGQELSRCLAFGLQTSDIPEPASPHDHPVNMVSKVMSLKFASSPQLVSYNIQVAIDAFKRSPSDTGSAEVQAAILSVRMLCLQEHVTKHRHDYSARNALVILTHTRKKWLKYLRRVSLERFYTLLGRLGLPVNYLEEFEPKNAPPSK